MTTTDPRERLVQTGNELLSVIYREEIHHRENRALLDASRSGDTAAIHSAMSGIKSDRLAEIVIEMLKLQTDRQELIARYVLLRETIEQLTPAKGEQHVS